MTNDSDKQKVIKINGKKVEIVKWLVVTWFTLTMILLGFAATWGMMQKSVIENSKSIDKMHVALYGTDGISGLVKTIGNIENNIDWMRKLMEKDSKNVGVRNEEDK